MGAASMTAPEVSLGRCARVDPGESYGVSRSFTDSAVTLTSEQSGLVIDNNGATGTITFTPTSPALGDNYILHRMSAYNYPMRFQPASGHLVEGEAVDKYVELQSAGVMSFEYTRTGVWTIVDDACAWNPEP